MSDCLSSTPDRRVNFESLIVVEKAISIGKQTGFIDAADFMYTAHIPQPIAIRLLAEISLAKNQL